MRVVTGKYKGRKLAAPYGKEVRPTSDKVKEAIFSMISPYIYDGAVVVDLFAGTGALGIEALSRGAGSCIFCDNSRESIKVIKENLEHCGIGGEASVMVGDFASALERMRGKADVFFIDPPYASGHYEKSLALIDMLDLLEDDGIIVTEHEKGAAMPETVGRLRRSRVRDHGKISVTLYEKAVDTEDTGGTI